MQFFTSILPTYQDFWNPGNSMKFPSCHLTSPYHNILVRCDIIALPSNQINMLSIFEGFEEFDDVGMVHGLHNRLSLCLQMASRKPEWSSLPPPRNFTKTSSASNKGVVRDSRGIYWPPRSLDKASFNLYLYYTRLVGAVGRATVVPKLLDRTLIQSCFSPSSSHPNFISPGELRSPAESARHVSLELDTSRVFGPISAWNVEVRVRYSRISWIIMVRGTTNSPLCASQNNEVLMDPWRKADLSYIACVGLFHFDVCFHCIATHEKVKTCSCWHRTFFTDWCPVWTTVGVKGAHEKTSASNIIEYDWSIPN